MFIKIGELAKRSQCNVQTIRYYEKEGLLPEPSRSESNYRLYTDAHIDHMQFIRHCRMLGLSLAEIKILLKYRDAPDEDCGEINQLLDMHIDQVHLRIKELADLKQDLVVLRDQCSGSRPAQSCGILHNLSGRSTKGTKVSHS
jgi:Cd(II)/Pb(II)-responsive transcriptional regulator